MNVSISSSSSDICQSIFLLSEGQWSLFLSILAAFDPVDRFELWYCLWGVECLQRMCRSSKRCTSGGVRDYGQLLTLFVVSIAVQQNYSTFSFLFNIFIENIIQDFFLACWSVESNSSPETVFDLDYSCDVERWCTGYSTRDGPLGHSGIRMRYVLWTLEHQGTSSRLARACACTYPLWRSIIGGQ